MKRIFINDIPVLFKNLDNSKLKVENYDTLIDGSSGIIHTKLRARVLIYDALPDSIDSLLKIMTEKKLKKTYSVTFTLKNKKEVIKYLKKKFKVIKAAGGIVQNNENKILFIYRLGKWDLPKGKKDKGEKIKDCAVREVEEETNTKVKIIKRNCTTWHTYTRYKKFILKKTVWYKMKCIDDSKMKGQKKEKIEKVRWMENKIINEILINSYKSLSYVVKKYFKKDKLNT
tara:strand:- start:928 stop:1614 length:687 start_codon:yes stop_codon:yes gene_type:complete